MAKKKASAPSGLTVNRKGNNIVFSWKIKDNKCSGQTLEYNYGNVLPNGSIHWHRRPTQPGGSAAHGTTILWLSISLGKNVTSKTIKKVNEITAIRFRVKCSATGKEESDWSSIKSYRVYAPDAPAISMSVVNDLTSTFAWETKSDTTSNKPFVRNYAYTILSTNCNVGSGGSVTGSWENLNKPAAKDSYSKQEIGWNLNSISKTRWVRVRAEGWNEMFSNWSYAKRVYATPIAASNVKANRYASNSGYAVSVTWTSQSTYARPIDSTAIESVKTVPVVTVNMPPESSGTVTMNISCPDSGLSWNSRLDTGGMSANRSIAFVDSEGIPDDNCFFVRVTHKHDNQPVSSTPVLATGGYGNLVAPSIPSVGDPTGRLYPISVSSRGTSINNAAIAVWFKTSSAQDKPMCIGVMPPGYSTVNCIIPEVPSGDTFAFGAQAFVGDYSPKEAPSGSTEVTEFKPSPLMSSDISWGTDVPLAPTISVKPVNDSTIEVKWDWSWTDALQAELSWSDHKDAWNSTDEPSTYIVNSNKTSVWRIAGLSVGTWYVRVRLLKTIGDSTSYSDYSSTVPTKLASSPDTPSLLVSPTVVPQTGTITCYWAYVSGDGTGQRQAVICEAVPEYSEVESPTGDPYENDYYERVGETEETYKYVKSFDREVVEGKTYYQQTGNVSYGKEVPGGKVESAQHLSLSVEQLGWLPGETHHLAVQVTSMSMETSKGWSSPVAVTIAEEPSINIISTSLVSKNDIPSEYNNEGEATEYRSALSMTHFPLDITVNDFPVGSVVTCIIDRADDYPIERPDDTSYIGFKGETVLMKDYNTSTFSIEQKDMIGYFDDGASYNMTLILSDGYGQTIQTTEMPVYVIVADPSGNPQENGWYVLVNDDYILTTDTTVVEGTTYYSKETTTSFEVHWDHQAVMPEATIEIDTEENVTFITPEIPESGFAAGDMVDIYRLSSDPPELIYAGAELTSPGTKYVDPYPAIGDFGGHRIVYRTINGDYITEENQIAFTDYTADENEAYKHKVFGIIIDFGKDQMILPGNVSFSNKWSKDFTLTKYLGGAVQGDWNPAVERSMSANITIPVEYERENIELIRRLAVYPGICHVRTPDGSSFAANIDVNDDREEKWTTKLAKVSLSITKCDPEGYDGMTYEDWIKSQQ